MSWIEQSERLTIAVETEQPDARTADRLLAGPKSLTEAASLSAPNLLGRDDPHSLPPITFGVAVGKLSWIRRSYWTNDQLSAILPHRDSHSRGRHSSPNADTVRYVKCKSTQTPPVRCTLRSNKGQMP